MRDILQHTFPPDLSGIYTEALANQLANTQGAIGSLKQLPRLLHNPNLLMHPILVKEAESSSQLEGTQASLEDVYKIDIVDQTPEKKIEAQEIKNYEDAMIAGMHLIKKYGLNIFSIRQIHKTLMQGVRGKEKHPGEYRKGDVWIGKFGTGKGQARYIPPDAVHVPALMESLEKFIQTNHLNPLIACGIIHHRFEGIHPFEDGNGRTGRLLISLYLVKANLITMPILYPSGFFEKNRDEYMANLSKVDKNEDWYNWLIFFLKGLQTQAEIALSSGTEIDELFKAGKTLIQDEAARLNLNKVLEYTFIQPYLTAPSMSRAIKIPRATCARYLALLHKKRVITDYGIYKKNRVYVNTKLIDILRNI